jgi:CrcB protein
VTYDSDDADVDPDIDLTHPPHVTGPAALDTWRTGAVVALGGAIGGLARLGVSTALPKSSGGFPWATFSENVAGCLLIGVLMVAVVERWPAHELGSSRLVRPFLGTGVLGGFTTFSAYTSDTRALLAGGHAATALAYLAGSVVAGLVAVLAGAAAARALLLAGRPAHPSSEVA